MKVIASMPNLPKLNVTARKRGNKGAVAAPVSGGLSSRRKPIKSVNSCILTPQRRLSLDISGNGSFLNPSTTPSPSTTPLMRSNKGIPAVSSISSLSSILNKRSKTRHSNSDITDSFLVQQMTSSADEDEGQLVIIKLLSIWGNSNFLRISSISILDEKFVSVPILKAHMSPDLGISNNVMDLLFNGQLMKKEVNEMFSIPWCYNHDPVDLLIFVPSELTISGARVFNADVDPESSVKDISITLDNVNTLNGEIPRLFGIDFKFTMEMRIQRVESSRLIKEFYNENRRQNNFVDIYGQYPLLGTHKLIFELQNNYNNEFFYGLNGFEIFDEIGSRLMWDDVENVIIHNCGTFSDPRFLFKPKMKTSNHDSQFLMKMQTEEVPSIEILFKEIQFISRIVIWNYNSAHAPVDYGVRQIKIATESNNVWSGRVLRSIGCEKGAAKNIKTVWLIDLPELRDENYESRETKMLEDGVPGSMLV